MECFTKLSKGKVSFMQIGFVTFLFYVRLKINLHIDVICFVVYYYVLKK